MYPCSTCNRTFTSDRIAQHEAACARANKQRRIFDSTKQRLEGTEAAMFYRNSRGGKGRNEPLRPQVNEFGSFLFVSSVETLHVSSRYQNQIGDKNMKILFVRSVTQKRLHSIRKQVCTFLFQHR